MNNPRQYSYFCHLFEVINNIIKGFFVKKSFAFLGVKPIPLSKLFKKANSVNYT